MTTMAALEVRCLTTGTVRTKRGERGARRYLPGGWRADTAPVNVFLVRHRAGVCLFDAGQTARAARTGYFPRWYPFFRLARFELEPEDEVAAQLQRLGLADEPLRWVVLSHLHTDHVGGLDALAADEVLVSRAEWRHAAGAVAGRLRGYLPQYWPERLQPRLVNFEGPPIGPFVGSHDLSGDGALVLVPTAGHTPGHMSLLVAAAGRRYLLAGDLCESGNRLAAADPALAAWCAQEAVTVLCTHDAEAEERLHGGG
jgi:glyoxylase-like metal-dependent hydrolase (beta-lactamase superfamily II)